MEQSLIAQDTGVLESSHQDFSHVILWVYGSEDSSNLMCAPWTSDQVSLQLISLFPSSETLLDLGKTVSCPELLDP